MGFSGVEIKKILVRVPNWIGDVIMSLPALEALKSNFQSSSLTVLARPWVKDILENHPAVDSLLSYNSGGKRIYQLKTMLWTARILRRERFDMAVLFQNAFEAALLSMMGGIRYRVGYDTDGRGFLLTHKVRKKSWNPHGHQVEYYMNILKKMGLVVNKFDPKLYISRQQVEGARELLREKGIQDGDLIVGLGPGAVYGEAKRWPAERFAAVADLAASSWGASILILGGEEERNIGSEVERFMKKRSVNLCGRLPLWASVGVLSLCDFFVTNDSGLMHIAAALDVPTIAIFGSTDPVATGPRSPKAVVIKHDIPCAPCFKRVCPIDFQCMLSIESQEVWSSLVELKKEVEK